MQDPHPTPIPLAPRPIPQRLAAAKLALLEETRETRRQPAPPSGAQTAKDAALGAVRQQPLLVMGAASLLGFFLIRKNFFFKRIIMLLLVRIGMTAVKRVLK